VPASSTDAAFERVLAAVGQCLDRRSAEALLRLRADREMQGRIVKNRHNSFERRRFSCVRQVLQKRSGGVVGRGARFSFALSY